MGPTELLRLVGERLDRLHCQRFTTGSVAAMVYGEPRFTNDVDVVVRMDESQAGALAASFSGDEWYVSAEAARAAARSRGMFNIIHVPSGLKVDIMVSPESPHDMARFARVRMIVMPDGRLEPIAAPEDVILKKLMFFREGGSRKHVRDSASIILTQGADGLDWRYLRDWASRLGVAEQLALVRTEAGLPPQPPPSA